MSDTETATAPPDRRATLLARLRQALGPASVIDDEEALRRLATDMLMPRRGGSIPPAPLPLAAALPRSTADVAAALRVAQELGVATVEFGGGTGLMGGARTLTPGLVLDLREMTRIHSISAEDRVAHVEAGAVLAEIGRAAEPLGLIVGHDPWTYPIATAGGTFSTNGLGYLGGKYGAMGDQVLGVTVVLAGGAIVQTRPAERSSTGPRLKQLFAGAEGTLGVVTELDLRLFHRPERERLRGYRFRQGFDAGFIAIEALIATGVQPATIDFGQTRAWELEDAPVAPRDEEGILYLAFHGLADEVKVLKRAADRVIGAHGGERLPKRRAAEFWANRHVDPAQIRARQQAGGAGGDWPPQGLLVDFLHVWLPASRVLATKQQAQTLLLERGVSVGEWGLWHGPELFSIAVFTRGRDEADARRLGEACDAVLALVQDAGGSMEYVHGAGVRLAHLMPREHGAGMDVLRSVKRALDPSGLLNPGKLGL
jgi:FAD/FMN-containing dehydrogenase